MPTAMGQVEVIGKNPREKVWALLREHSAPGEAPWFVIGAGMGGVFSAFDDRCMIVKVGALTSMMAGSLGGGRVTTFYYREITGLEYNSGLVNGVLEVLTASYQGTRNKDFWRGTFKGRNANSDDPWTLSNCLPVDKVLYKKALPLLTQLRARLAEPATGPQSNDLAEKLGRLAALHEQGMLTDDEFIAAKKVTLGN